MSLNFIDFEVFRYDWLCVITNPITRDTKAIVNSSGALFRYYEQHKNDVWIGYNIREYDQWIFKGILAGFDAYEINDFIVNQGYRGYQFSKTLNDYPLIIFDLLQLNTSLKQLEAFQGHSIYESDVDFNLDRKLSEDEIIETIKYCQNDVQETMDLFILNRSDFDSQLELVNEFKLPSNYIGKTQSQLTAAILQANKRDCNDEFKLSFPAYLDRISKYRYIVEWYKNMDNRDYERSLITTVGGLPHIYAWGGLHGAKGEIRTDKKGKQLVKSIPYYGEGYYLHIDVNSYYPSLMITHDYFSRAVPESGKERFKRIYSENLSLKKQIKTAPEDQRAYLKKKRTAYKLVCNKTYGCFKDHYNSLYDPLMSNNICVTGQLALTLLIEMLEDYVELIQSNTDGLIVKLHSLDDYEIVDDIAYEWEQLTGVKLGFDPIITKIYQKDVNNYLFIDEFGDIESKGAYVKSLSPTDNDLPIINKALREYMINDVLPEATIMGASKLIDFQKVVKLSSAYDYVEHNGHGYSNKCYRVFASNNESDGIIYKCKFKVEIKKDKFANTPEHCFIENGDITDAPTPEKLDKQWYIDLAYERLRQFGVEI